MDLRAQACTGRPRGGACCDVVSRGAAFADGRLFCNTLDAQTIAVDAATGKEIWSRQVGGISETIWQDYSTAPD